MADPEIDDPLSSEAQAQDEQTLMPWIWGGFGLLVIAVFVVWIVFSNGGHRMREPAAAAPFRAHSY